MGRRKIEIKPIRDDRNRSVTFLKRKGGLFKKAHELSVLCSVDVAVIIFGHNKKLYEYSSSDINEIIGRFQYYGGAHEHKGPTDFADKGGGDDDDDDDGDGADDIHERNTPVPEHHIMHAHMQNHPGFQRVQHGTPTASPPMPNGAMPTFNRGPSPVPPGMSRPSSRTSQHPGHNRRTSANYANPHHPTQGTPPQPGYGFPHNGPVYNHPSQGPIPNRSIPYGHQSTYPPPSFPPTSQPIPPPPHLQQAYLQPNRGGSMPPAYPMPAPVSTHPDTSRHPSQEHRQPPPPPPSQRGSPRPPQQRPTPSPQPVQQEFASPPLPQPKPLPAHSKSHSIFTPIDDSRSMLAQHWGTSTMTADSNKADAIVKPEDGGPRSQSIDIASIQRGKPNMANGSSSIPPPPPRSRSPKHEALSQATSNPPPIQPPSRTGTNQSDTKRPRLKVQIPSEQSDDEAGEGGSGTEEPSTSRPSQQQPQHSVVLPPPSPSAGALLSAGAQGPPNPFARPAPPMTRDSNHVETPISALPSRFMSDNLLPSPSTFYPEWGFGRSGDSNMLPSPLNFQTPVVSNGSGWRDEERKRPHEEDTGGGDAKRNKG